MTLEPRAVSHQELASDSPLALESGSPHWASSEPTLPPSISWRRRSEFVLLPCFCRPRNSRSAPWLFPAALCAVFRTAPELSSVRNHFREVTHSEQLMPPTRRRRRQGPPRATRKT